MNNGWPAIKLRPRKSRRQHFFPSESSAIWNVYRGPYVQKYQTLFNFDPPVTPTRSGRSLQFVRKISGFHKPSKANEESFNAAIEEIAAASSRLLRSLEPRRSTEPRRGSRQSQSSRRSALATEPNCVWPFHLLVFRSVRSAGIFCVIALYIWRGQDAGRTLGWSSPSGSCSALFCIMKLRKRSLARRQSRAAAKLAAPVFLSFIVALICVGIPLGALHRLPAHLIEPPLHRLFRFLHVQQLALQSMR